MSMLNYTEIVENAALCSAVCCPSRLSYGPSPTHNSNKAVGTETAGGGDGGIALQILALDCYLLILAPYPPGFLQFPMALYLKMATGKLADK